MGWVYRDTEGGGMEGVSKDPPPPHTHTPKTIIIHFFFKILNEKILFW